MELFELTRIMFEDPEAYKEATKGDKRKNFFIIQRRMAIQHPMQANVLNGLKINQEEAIDVWQRFLRKKYKKTPFWMYTKGIKKVKEEKEKKINISTQVVEDYAKKYKIDLKSVWEALDMFPKKMKKELQDFEKINK
jgi:hypothetical protein